jgi:hypothetical protein
MVASRRRLILAASIANKNVVVVGRDVVDTLLAPRLAWPKRQALFWETLLAPAAVEVVVFGTVVVEAISVVEEELVVEVVVLAVLVVGCVVVVSTGGNDTLQGQKRRAVSIAFALQREA